MKETITPPAGGRLFKAGEPACPIACRYCFITEHDARRTVWNKNPMAGINKACTFVNVTPWINEDPTEQSRFRVFPWRLLRGDFVGFTAVTDPFWPRLGRYLWEWIAQASPEAKLLTCVTKWPVPQTTITRLAAIHNFFLVVSITGNEALERVTTRQLLDVLARAKTSGLAALPIVHPYIAGVSDLSFLADLKNLGYAEVGVKGLRYCDRHMESWMPQESLTYYANQEDKEVLPEDGWRKRVADAGLTLLSPQEWYLREGSSLPPHLDQETAERMVDRIMAIANVVSSDQLLVREAAVRRRL